MTGLDILTEPISAKLNACERQQEAWKYDHEGAKAVYNFEDLLGDLVETFDDIKRIYASFSRRVMENPNSYSEEYDEKLLGLHARFHDVAIAVNTILEFWEQQYGEITNAMEFRSRLADATASSKACYQSETMMDIAVLQNEVDQLLTDEIGD